MLLVLFDEASDHSLVRNYLAAEDGRNTDSAAIVYSDSKLTAVRSVDPSLYQEWLAKARVWQTRLSSASTH